MAKANHKSRPVVTERFVTVQESARHHSLSMGSACYQSAPETEHDVLPVDQIGWSMA